MPREFITEYRLDPGDYIQKVLDQFRERCPEFTERPVEEAIFVDDGPIDYLVWFALDDYEHHTFFCQDEDPDQELLRRFIFLSPGEDEMAKFKRVLQRQFGIYRELDRARLLEIPDVYQPHLGTRPRAHFGICYEPGDDRLVSGISATPRTREREILENVDKMVPDRDLEKFISRTVGTVNDQIEAEADRHTIDSDVRDELSRDSDFRYETTKPLPKGIHPKYTDCEAELWQKSASRVDHMDGSEGFLRIWIPVDDDGITLVDATAGEYDRGDVVDAVRRQFESTTV